MPILNFVFFKYIQDVQIEPLLRVSIWLEENGTFLMPCEFIEVVHGTNSYFVKIFTADPEKFASDIFIGKKFFFGHPGRIIGHGILKEIIYS